MTTRRSFFRSLALGAAAFAVLPSALTYRRTWKATASGIYQPVELDIDPRLLGGTVRQLFSEERQAQMYILSQSIEAHLRKFWPDTDGNGLVMITDDPSKSRWTA
jgi:hypothetical protein